VRGARRDIGSNAGDVQAGAILVQLAAADRIDGGLAEDELPESQGAKPEEPLVLTRAGSHSASDARPGAEGFGAEGPLGFSGHLVARALGGISACGSGVALNFVSCIRLVSAWFPLGCCHGPFVCDEQ